MESAGRYGGMHFSHLLAHKRFHCVATTYTLRFPIPFWYLKELDFSIDPKLVSYA